MSIHTEVQVLKDEVRYEGGVVLDEQYVFEYDMNGEVCYLKIDGLSERDVLDLVEGLGVQQYVVYEEDGYITAGIRVWENGPY